MMQQMKIMMMPMLLLTASAQAPPECKKFSELYKSGKDICDKMWHGAFTYEEDEENAYTMWWFDKENPNNEVTKKLVNRGDIENLVGGVVDKCYLSYNHKGDDEPLRNDEHPTEEAEDFQECHPWSESSCCHQENVKSASTLKALYEDHYNWDSYCGSLSQSCERFFVMEACFYECDANAGIYRKHKDLDTDPNPFGAEKFPLHTDPTCVDTDAWSIKSMPIKASFFDAWWMACKDDHFCSEDEGDYGSCAKAWKGLNEANKEQDQKFQLPGSCSGSCNGKAKDGPCMCDEACETADPSTCCADREEYCKPTWVSKLVGSCKDTCDEMGASDTATANCWCDGECSGKGDCCSDIDEMCNKKEVKTLIGSCAGSCASKSISPGSNCHCDDECHKPYNLDCCSDITESCGAEGSPCRAGADC